LDEFTTGKGKKKVEPLYEKEKIDLA